MARRLVMSVVLLLAVAGGWVAGHGVPDLDNPVAAQEERHTLNGTLTINDGGEDGILSPGMEPGDACIAFRPSPPPAYGTDVVVRDATDTIIGVGFLDLGITSGSNACEWPFIVPNLPTTDFYQVSIGDYLTVTRTLDWVTEAEWSLTFSLNP